MCSWNIKAHDGNTVQNGYFSNKGHDQGHIGRLAVMPSKRVFSCACMPNMKSPISLSYIVKSKNKSTE